MSTAIIGAGVMGETLLSGLVRAGRRVDQLMVGEKRPDRAIEIATRAGMRLRIAAKVDKADLAYWQAEIEPLVRANPLVEYVGEFERVFAPLRYWAFRGAFAARRRLLRLLRRRRTAPSPADAE